MQLPDFTPTRVKVEYKGSLLITVRGLNLTDLSELISSRLDDLRKLSEVYQGPQSEIFARLQADDMFSRLLLQAPDLVIEMMLRAGDIDRTQEATSTAMQWPLGIQLKVLREVSRLTLEDVGGPKGLAALLKTMMNETK